MTGRLQFRHKKEVFSTKVDAINYLSNLSSSETLSPKLSEPTVVLYGTEEEPNILLAIGRKERAEGSATNPAKLTIIDWKGTEDDIAALKTAVADHDVKIADIIEEIEEIKTSTKKIKAADKTIGVEETATNFEVKVRVKPDDGPFKNALRLDEGENGLMVDERYLTNYNGKEAVKVSDRTSGTTGPQRTVSLGIDSSDKVLSQSDNGLKANISLKYDETVNELQLLGEGGHVITGIPVTTISKDGFLKNVNLTTDNHLVFTWNDDAGLPVQSIDLNKFFFMPKKGLEVESDKTVNVKIRETATDKYLKVDESGLYLEGIDNKIATEADKKVDKETGKSLIEDTMIDKLVRIENDAQVNVIEHIRVNGSDIAPDSEKRVTLPVAISIDPNDKVLSEDLNHSVKTVMNLRIRKEGDHKYIELLGKDSSVVTYIDANDFVVSGFLREVKLEITSGGTEELVFIWDTASGESETRINLSKYIDVYKAGNAIEIGESGRTINVKLSEDSGITDHYLAITTGANGGLMTTGITAGFEAASAYTDTKVAAEETRAKEVEELLLGMRAGLDGAMLNFYLKDQTAFKFRVNLQPIIDAAVEKAIEKIFNDSASDKHFLDSANIKATVDSTNKTVTMDFTDSASFVDSTIF